MFCIPSSAQVLEAIAGMAEIQGPLPDLNLEAVTAIIRYEAPEQARWPQDPQWVNLNYIYTTKKRFHKNFSIDIFKQVIEQEMDRGQPRFRVYTDPEGVAWVRSVHRNERRANR
jgi:hypothetical protein